MPTLLSGGGEGRIFELERHSLERTTACSLLVALLPAEEAQQQEDQGHLLQLPRGGRAPTPTPASAQLAEDRL